jgi:hypothetical protein
MSINEQSEPAVEPIVVRPKVARQLLGGISHDRLNDKIKSGELESYLDDSRRRLITVASIKASVARRVAAAAATGFEYARGARRPAAATPQSQDDPPRRKRAVRRAQRPAKRET